MAEEELLYQGQILNTEQAKRKLEQPVGVVSPFLQNVQEDFDDTRKRNKPQGALLTQAAYTVQSNKFSRGY